MAKNQSYSKLDLSSAAGVWKRSELTKGRLNVKTGINGLMIRDVHEPHIFNDYSLNFCRREPLRWFILVEFN